MNATRISLALMLLPASLAFASELRGSRASMVRQHHIAVEENFTFLRTAKQLHEFVHDDRLEQVSSTNDLVVATGVSYAYTRPIVKQFVDRLAAEYHVATGERLVVTSLTRPESEQPRNASPLSVHPAGMAVDFRVPDAREKRAWLEQRLLSLEDKGVLDVTREVYPPHYHVAVFPEQYEAFAKTLPSIETAPTTPNTTVPKIALAASHASLGTNGARSRADLVISAGVFLCALTVGARVRRKMTHA